MANCLLRERRVAILTVLPVEYAHIHSVSEHLVLREGHE